VQCNIIHLNFSWWHRRHASMWYTQKQPLCKFSQNRTLLCNI